MASDPFTSLSPSSRAPSARAHSRAPSSPPRTRLRVGVGAAVVLLLAALGVTVAVTAIGQVGHSVEVAANSGTGVSPGDGTAAPPVEPTTSAQPTAGQNPVIFVHVLGAVAHPGLFEVNEGARVVDVVAAAGGLLPTADQTGVNLARLVSDGEQLYVPVQGEVVPAAGAQGGSGAGTASGANGSASGATTTVNLNTATAADLDTLPRIGPAMAQRILDYREAEGRFASVEDLRNVTGIGEKTFAALKDLVSV
ncbi:helix-hairpin-helix domain-containing protein [Cryobacterium sp. SO2]|uniref:ComEA family DNA-binding protein n=1 Tax=Cryobacterium sp. SO2 TaxID=1897060 RepID=UPI00223E2E2F|nr:helix-hairpin-helix domain-containing protein [Cryobacterium sp. SO2]WEO79071.1 helix-hairpin-helix domain-containing protein [Cryobacterium sp. SO2]